MVHNHPIIFSLLTMCNQLLVFRSHGVPYPHSKIIQLFVLKEYILILSNGSKFVLEALTFSLMIFNFLFLYSHITDSVLVRKCLPGIIMMIKTKVRE